MAVKWKLKHRVTDILWQNAKRWSDSKLLTYTHARTITLGHSYSTQPWWIHNILHKYNCHRCLFPHLSSQRCTHTSFESETNTVTLCWVQWNSTTAKKITCLVFHTTHAQLFTNGFGNCICVSQNWWIRLTNTSKTELKIENTRETRQCVCERDDGKIKNTIGKNLYITSYVVDNKTSEIGRMNKKTSRNKKKVNNTRHSKFRERIERVYRLYKINDKLFFRVLLLKC